MLVIADNDVRGAVAAIRHVLESAEWHEYTAALDIRFGDLEVLGLSRDATDRLVWETCQNFDALLVTANRAGGDDSLDRVIRESSDLDSLPVITIADPQCLVRDRRYANETAIALLDFLERIDSLRGVGRLFIREIARGHSDNCLAPRALTTLTLEPSCRTGEPPNTRRRYAVARMCWICDYRGDNGPRCRSTDWSVRRGCRQRPRPPHAAAGFAGCRR